MKSKKEAEILKEVCRRLNMLVLTGDVIIWRRLHSMQLSSIRVGQPGDPDLLVVVDRKDGFIAVLFLEVKREGSHRLRLHQHEFFESMQGKPKILCRVINNESQLWGYIQECKRL